MCCSSRAISARAASRAAGSFDRSARASGAPHGPRVLDVAGALGDGDDAEFSPAPDPALDRGRDARDAVRDLRDDHVGAAGEPGPQRESQPAPSVSPGEVAVGRAVEAVDRFVSSAVAKPKVASVIARWLSIVLGRVRTLSQAFVGAAARSWPPARRPGRRGSRSTPGVGRDDRLGHVADLAVDDHPVRLVAARAEDRAAGEREEVSTGSPCPGGESAVLGESPGSRRGSRRAPSRRSRWRPCRSRGSQH